MPIMNFAQMLAAGVGPSGILLNDGGLDGAGGGMNPLLTKGGTSTVGGGTYVPFGSAGAGDPATRLASMVEKDFAPGTVISYGPSVGSYGGTPAPGSSKANWMAGIGTGSAPVAPTPNYASGGLAGQQQQTSYLRKLAEIVKAPKRQSIGETNTSDIPQQ